MRNKNQEMYDYPVDWHHWIHRKTLTANQAAQLMMSLDPYLPSASRKSLEMQVIVRYATSIYQLALSQGFREAPMSHWLEWGNMHEIKMHPLFTIKTFEWKAMYA